MHRAELLKLREMTARKVLNRARISTGVNPFAAKVSATTLEFLLGSRQVCSGKLAVSKNGRFLRYYFNSKIVDGP